MSFCYSCKPFMPCTVYLPFHYFIISLPISLLSLSPFSISLLSLATGRQRLQGSLLSCWTSRFKASGVPLAKRVAGVLHLVAEPSVDLHLRPRPTMKWAPKLETHAHRHNGKATPLTTTIEGLWVSWVLVLIEGEGLIWLWVVILLC